jgi:plastocyanin
MVPPRGSEMVTGPPAMANVTEAAAANVTEAEAPEANVTEAEANVTEAEVPEGETLPLVNETDTNATETEGTTGTTEETGAAPPAEGGATTETETGATGGDTGVSIVPGSSSLTTDANQPNPVQVSVGDTVTWTNDDSQPHTATSGEAVIPDGRFDSGIMAPAATFDFTFTEAGEYPYFCLLHPNMVGTVSVS